MKMSPTIIIVDHGTDGNVVLLLVAKRSCSEILRFVLHSTRASAGRIHLSIAMSCGGSKARKPCKRPDGVHIEPFLSNPC